MISNRLVLFGIVTALIFSLAAGFNSIYAAPVTIDLHKAKIPGPGFGPEKIGTATIDTTGNKVTISANTTAKAKPDKAFEAWLVDVGGSNYKLSLGKFDNNGHLEFTENMVNPYTYKQFIVTEEPLNDIDPNAADTYGGSDLSSPFGQ
jgi:Anti-sigma-K factor rskA, C-terminal